MTLVIIKKEVQEICNITGLERNRNNRMNILKGDLQAPYMIWSGLI